MNELYSYMWSLGFFYCDGIFFIFLNRESPVVYLLLCMAHTYPLPLRTPRTCQIQTLSAPAVADNIDTM